VACADHATTLVDLSPIAIAMNGHGPPAAKSRGGGDLVQSTDAPTHANYGPMYGILGEPILVPMEAEDDGKADREVRVL
jgi:hypothetical protein